MPGVSYVSEESYGARAAQNTKTRELKHALKLKGACVRVDARADSKDPARGRRARVLT